MALSELKEQRKSWIVIDSPTSAISIVTALLLGVLYLINAEKRPLEAGIERNKEDIKVLTKEIRDGFKIVTEALTKPKP